MSLNEDNETRLSLGLSKKFAMELVAEFKLVRGFETVGTLVLSLNNDIWGSISDP